MDGRRNNGTFKKGHPGYNKGSKYLKRKEYRTLEKSPQAIDKYPITKHWEKRTSKRVLDQETLEYYIYNDLPIDEYYDSLKLRDADEDVQGL